MSRIKILDDALVNRIAAGEVVERPASVIKELVENSLDAGATEVIVEVERGGRRLIRVSDNGSGMDHDECLMAIERHATSKISDEADLMGISTLGFRGEAMPAIAAVSRFCLTSKRPEDEAGTRLSIEGGVLKKVEQVGCPDGTSIEVRDLFFNTPARRRFLRSIETETGHVIDVLTRFGLSRPEVRFALSHNGRSVFTLARDEDLMARVAALLGPEIHRAMIQISSAAGDVETTGAIASPDVDRGTGRHIYVFVNNRAVRDRVLSSAVMEGFRDHLMRGRYPVAVLHLRMPADLVDVNVHPAKAEVRFREGRAVHAAVAGAVREALLSRGRPIQAAKEGREERIAVAVARFSERGSSEPRPTPWRREEQRPAMGNEAQADLVKQERDRPPWRLIGQVMRTYVMAEGDEGLVIIDQHAAHERVMYERVLGQFEAGRVHSQALLLPITLDLAGAEAEALEEISGDLERFGVAVERFGPRTFVIKSLPASVPESAAGALVRDLVEDVLAEGSIKRLDAARDLVLERIACHSAIRAGAELNEHDMRRLIIDLAGTENPDHCPHGRPTHCAIPEGDLERMFKRK